METPKDRWTLMKTGLALSPVQVFLRLKRFFRLQGSAVPFEQKILQELGIYPEVSQVELDRLPRSGGLLLLVNRPYGHIEACALLASFGALRPDLRFFEDRLLEQDERSAQWCLGPGGEQERWQRGTELLRNGGALVVFVDRTSSRSPRRHQGKSLFSNLSLAILARETGASVQVAQWSGGKRRLALRALGLAKPGLRRRLLSHGPLLNANGRLELRLGAAVPFQRLQAFASEAEAAEYLALRRWLLINRGRKVSEANPLLTPGPKKSIKPLASALPKELLQAEIDGLPPEACLAVSGVFRCFLAPASMIPNLLREIGREREETFRAVGEGTGLPLDLDRFDAHYLHLFLWHEGEQAIAGGYRLGPTDTILASQGPEGLYTQTLLKMKAPLLRLLDPALEMGRSFVALRFQRSFAPLMLLWKGVGAFVGKNPRYRRLFGMVSISADYQPLSRELIASYIKQNLFRGDLASLATPRHPYAPAYGPSRHDALTWRLGRDLEEVSAWISELEHDGKGLPVLFKQYTRLGGEFFGFNVDPAFGDALDGMVCVDLLNTDPRTLEKYLGSAGLKQFQAFHGVGAKT